MDIDQECLCCHEQFRDVTRSERSWFPVCGSCKQSLSFVFILTGVILVLLVW